MREKGFSVSDTLRFGFQEWKKRWAFFIGLALFAMLLPLLPQCLESLLSEGAFFAKGLLGLIHMIFMVIVNMGTWTIALKAAKGQSYEFTDFFSKFHLFPSFLLGGILFFLAVLGGTILLIIPGIIFALKFSLWPFFVLDHSFKGLDALKASNIAVYGAKWDILLFFLATCLLNLIGALFVGVGLLITMPITWIAWAYIYVKLQRIS